MGEHRRACSHADHARQQGRRSGYDPAEQAADCPYDHVAFALRQHWLAGFAEGRGRYRVEHDTWSAWATDPSQGHAGAATGRGMEPPAVA